MSGTGQNSEISIYRKNCIISRDI